MATSQNKQPAKRWSQRVTKTSNALDLDAGVFTWKSPRRIALSLKRSAEASTRRKAGPFQSAMSMLNFYLNRGGRVVTERQKQILMQAKDELRKVFANPPREAVGKEKRVSSVSSKLR